MTAHDCSIGLAEAWAKHLARQKARHPNAALKDMFDRGAGIEDLFSEMNKLLAVVPDSVSPKPNVTGPQ